MNTTTRHSQNNRPLPLASEKIRTEDGRKEFFIDLHENPRGRFIKFTERFGHTRNTVLIPVEVLDQIMAGMKTVIQEGGNR